MTLSDKEIEKVLRKKNVLRSAIDKQEKRSDMILHGSRAVNIHLPKRLEKKPELDFDYFSDDPKENLKKIEDYAEDSMNIDAYGLEESEDHEGTWKLRNKATGKSPIQITKKERKIPYKIIKGRRVVTKAYIRAKGKQVLDDPDSEFRHIQEELVLAKLRIANKKKKKSKRNVGLARASKKTRQRVSSKGGRSRRR